MAPVVRHGELCIMSFNFSVQRNTSSMPGTNNYSEDDKHALLYIVCTLLFYSLGMMIGIVSYIKREKQDIEQDRMFNDFLTSFRGKTEAIHYRQLKVQETIERLAEIERVSNESFYDLEAGKLISGGTKLGDEMHLHKVANLSLLHAPVVLLNSMTSLVVTNEPENDKGNSDPFQDRRLSEVVAEILDDKCDVNSSDVVRNNSKDNGSKNIQIDVNDFNREQNNEEVFKELSENIAEPDVNDDKMVRKAHKVVDNHEAVSPHDNQEQVSSKGNSDNCCTKTTKSKSKETCFGVTISPENPNITDGERIGKEHQEGQKVRNFRWSVTSV